MTPEPEAHVGAWGPAPPALVYPAPPPTLLRQLVNVTANVKIKEALATFMSFSLGFFRSLLDLCPLVSSHPVGAALQLPPCW